MFVRRFTALLVVASSILSVSAATEVVTVDGNNYLTSTFTQSDGAATTIIEIFQPGPEMVVTTTYVAVKIGPTGTSTITYEEEVLASLSTKDRSYMPTASGDSGYIIHCVTDQNGDGDCQDEIWLSDRPNPITQTLTYSQHTLYPAIQTFTVYEDASGNFTYTPPAASAITSSHRKVIGAAVGGVLGGLLCIAVACLLLVRRNNIKTAEARRARNSVSMARLGAAPGRGGQATAPYAFSVPAQGYVDSKVNISLPRTEDGYGADVKEPLDV